MVELINKNELIAYLQKNGLYTKHGLGQNFLIDKNVLDQIVGAAELKQEGLVIEVGPGVGTLTQELVRYAKKVLAVEIDSKLAELLISNFKFLISNENLNEQISNLEVINNDILKVNIPELVGDRAYKVVANIPYYITSKIIQLFLTAQKKPESVVVLTQKEVAERICAKPGEMSVLSVSVQVYGDPEIIGIVPASSFFPAPEVDSAILRIKNIHPFCHSELLSESTTAIRGEGIPDQVRDDTKCNEKAFFRAVHVGFASRRKTLLNNLMAGYHINRDQAKGLISATGLGENVRAQELSVEDWKRLVSVLSIPNF